MRTSTEPERTRMGVTEQLGWLAAAATIAGVAGIGMAIYQVATPGPPGSDFDSWDDFVLRDGLLLVYLLASIAAVTGARRAGLATRVSARFIAVGYGLISVGVAASLALRDDPEWFFALAGPGILLSAAGFVVLAVSGARRSRLPVWAALLAGVGGLVAIVMSEFGTTVLVASFWIYVASLTHRPPCADSSAAAWNRGGGGGTVKGSEEGRLNQVTEKGIVLMNRYTIRPFIAASTLRPFIASRMSWRLGGGPSRRMGRRLRLLGPFVALAAIGGVFTPYVSAEPGEPPVPEPPSTGLQAGFNWALSRYQDRGGDGFPDPARTAEDVQAGDFPVALDGCHSAQGSSPIVAYVWNLNGDEVRRADCRFTWAAPAKGTYPVSLTVETADGSTHSQTQLVVVRDDLLIASIGDSLGAGQGNPHTPAVWVGSNPPTVVVPATWEDTRCHRSATAGSAQAARRIEQRDPTTSVTFVHLACSGAQIVDRSWQDRDDRMGGLLDSYEGQDEAFKDEPRLQPQVYALRDLVKDRKIDALMVSIGVNDLGFASIIERCIAMDNCQAHLSREVAEKLKTLPAKYQELADRMHGAWWVPPAFPGLDRKKVFINEYPDFTHDDDGRFCSSLIAGTISTAETVWMADLGQRLNGKIRDAARTHGWTVVDKVADEYQRNGECADDHWFVRVEESMVNQGNIYGAMHPNTKGHTPLRERFLSSVQPALLSPLPPKVTVSGVALQGTHAVGTAPKVVVYDPLGLRSSASVTLDGAAYTSESPITSPGPHTLVVDATNTAGLRSTLTIPFSLEAVEVSSLSVAPPSVVGGMDAVASVRLNRSAPGGGVTVTFGSSNPAAAWLPETSVLIPEGESAAERAVKTVPVAQDTLATISATTPGGTPKSASLTVQAARVTAFALDEFQVAGGTAATATVYLDGPAPAGGLSLTLATSNSTVVPSKTISVPSGETRASSPVQTEVVSEPTAVTLSITGHPANPVNITVFPTRVVVPYVVGLSETAAVDLLRESGLTWKLTDEVGLENSKVHSQAPRGGTEVDFGTEVTLRMTTNHAT